MGKIKKTAQVKLIVAIMYKPKFEIDIVEKQLIELFGPIEQRSECFEFDQFTNYYEKEMEKNLKKYWISFEKPISREQLPVIKRKTNEIELELSNKPEFRDVNLDPGYLTKANLVLASTKDFSHRIYLNNGIFGDLHLIYKDKQFVSLPWTYADYKSELCQNFLKKVREKL